MLLQALLVCLLLTYSVHSQTYEDFNRLLSHLFNETRYNKKARPLTDQSQNVKVKVIQVLGSIESYDVQTGILKIQGFFQVSWYDELLVWDPNEYGGQTGFTLPKNMFWKPEITSSFGPSNNEINIMDVDFAPAYVIPSGHIVMAPAGRYETVCNVDTFYYPFDTHQCEFSLMVSNHLATEVTLSWEENSLQTYYTFTEHPEWELKLIRNVEDNLTDITSSHILARISNRFYVSRRPNYELVKTMLPLGLLTLVNIATFLIPPTSGERLSFSVTVFLALVFTNAAVMNDLPRNSLRLPMVSINIVILDCIIAFSVIYNVLIVKLGNTGSENLRIPQRLKTYLSRRKCRRKVTNVISLQSNKSTEECLTKDRSEPGLRTEAFKDNKTSQTDNYDADEITGADVACFLDTVFFIFAIVVDSAYAILNIVVLNNRNVCQ